MNTVPSIVVNMHEAKTNLSRLVEKVAQGESVVIARAGKPVVRMVAVEASVSIKKKRIGFLSGHVTVPNAQVFNDLGIDEIAEMFGGGA
jgi:prevent-host-death family protein